MDTRLLSHYERELSFMRDMGSEFAAAFPKIAGRLGMEGIEVLDPYVERLLEGFIFFRRQTQPRRHRMAAKPCGYRCRIAIIFFIFQTADRYFRKPG